jgi:hypothetical protein
MTDFVAVRGAGSQVSDTELLATLFDLGREVTSVLELNGRRVSRGCRQQRSPEGR